MFLPERYDIDIPSVKLNEYLLNRSHPLGWSKANYFFEHSIETADVLRKIVLDVISKNEVTKTIKTEFGLKYIVEGRIEEFRIRLRTVWIVLKGENICKFVTAYPL